VKEKGGSAGQRTAPTTMRRRESKPEGQKVLCLLEWRCLSRRDERTVATLSDEQEMLGDDAPAKSENKFQEPKEWSCCRLSETKGSSRSWSWLCLCRLWRS
jgi:hypothetical protein